MIRFLLLLFAWAVFMVVPGLANQGEKRLELTEGESDWIMRNPVIRVGMDEGYPPANFWDESGVVRGVDADFLAAISELTGIQFEYVRFNSWTETVEAVRSREVDMITCVTLSPEREEFLAFTEVYYDFPIAIITRSDAEFFATPIAARGRQVAVPEGFVTHEVMESIGWDVEVVRVPTITDAYLAVSTGQCYATVANLGNASYLIPRLGITNLKISGVMPEFTRSRFGVRKDWAILAGIIDKYFASLSEVEQSAIVEKWVRLDVPQAFNWDLAIRVMVGVALFVGATIFLVLWRNRQLRQQLAERARYQSALEEAHERVSLLNEEKSDLLHMVAHDMRGPLMTFQTGVGLVQHRLAKSNDHETGTLLSRMDRQTEAMQSLVDGLLDVEAIENGSRRIAKQSVDLRVLVEQVIEHAQEQATRKEIEIEWTAPVGKMRARGDMVAVRQIVENLLSNALKYSPIGGRVALRLIEKSGHLQLEVQDNGPGISPDEFSQLFLKFSRLSARPTDGESSHGLGLYIVKALAASMQGKVWCESQLGRGSTFYVTFPQDET
jgi:two-component system, NarL family, sensor histidine kinase EvgS